jgi:hypothetical protein
MSGTAAPDPKDQLVSILNTLWGDPDLGESVRRKAKEKFPQITIPDDGPVATSVRRQLDAERAAREALEKRLADRDAAEATARAESDLRNSLGRAQSRFKLTDDGLKGTMALMQERQIADAEAAAALYVDSLPKAPPSSPANAYFPGKFNLFGTTAKDDQWELFHTDPDAAFAKVVSEVFTEMPVGQ